MDDIASLGGYTSRIKRHGLDFKPLRSDWRRVSGGTLPHLSCLQVYRKLNNNKKAKSTVVVVKGTIIVHASQFSALAWLWNVKSYERMHKLEWEKSNTHILAEDIPMSRSKIVLKENARKGTGEEEGVFKQSWGIMDDFDRVIDSDHGEDLTEKLVVMGLEPSNNQKDKLFVLGSKIAVQEAEHRAAGSFFSLLAHRPTNAFSPKLASERKLASFSSPGHDNSSDHYTDRYEREDEYYDQTGLGVFTIRSLAPDVSQVTLIKTLNSKGLSQNAIIKSMDVLGDLRASRLRDERKVGAEIRETFLKWFEQERFRVKGGDSDDEESQGTKRSLVPSPSAIENAIKLVGNSNGVHNLSLDAKKISSIFQTSPELLLSSMKWIQCKGAGEGKEYESYGGVVAVTCSDRLELYNRRGAEDAEDAADGAEEENIRATMVPPVRTSVEIDASAKDVFGFLWCREYRCHNTAVVKEIVDDDSYCFSGKGCGGRGGMTCTVRSVVELNLNLKKDEGKRKEQKKDQFKIISNVTVTFIEDGGIYLIVEEPKAEDGNCDFGGAEGKKDLHNLRRRSFIVISGIPGGDGMMCRVDAIVQLECEKPVHLTHTLQETYAKIYGRLDHLEELRSFFNRDNQIDEIARKNFTEILTGEIRPLEASSARSIHAFEQLNYFCGKRRSKHDPSRLRVSCKGGGWQSEEHFSDDRHELEKRLSEERILTTYVAERSTGEAVCSIGSCTTDNSIEDTFSYIWHKKSREGMGLLDGNFQNVFSVEVEAKEDNRNVSVLTIRNKSRGEIELLMQIELIESLDPLPPRSPLPLYPTTCDRGDLVKTTGDVESTATSLCIYLITKVLYCRHTAIVSARGRNARRSSLSKAAAPKRKSANSDLRREEMYLKIASKSPVQNAKGSRREKSILRSAEIKSAKIGPSESEGGVANSSLEQVLSIVKLQRLAKAGEVNLTSVTHMTNLKLAHSCLLLGQNYFNLRGNSPLNADSESFLSNIYNKNTQDETVDRHHREMIERNFISVQAELSSGELRAVDQAEADMNLFPTIAVSKEAENNRSRIRTTLDFAMFAFQTTNMIGSKGGKRGSAVTPADSESFTANHHRTTLENFEFKQFPGLHMTFRHPESREESDMVRIKASIQARATEVAAFLWHINSRAMRSNTEELRRDVLVLDKSADKSPGNSIDFEIVENWFFPSLPRRLRCKMIKVKYFDCVILVTRPLEVDKRGEIEHPESTTTTKTQPRSVYSIVKIIPNGGDRCDVIACFRCLDRRSAHLAHSYVKNKLEFRSVVKAQRYFLKIRRLANCDVGDARDIASFAMAEFTRFDFFWQNKFKDFRAQRIRQIMLALKEFRSMQDADELYARFWFAMVEEVIRYSAPGSISSQLRKKITVGSDTDNLEQYYNNIRLESVTSEEGKRIGRAFQHYLRSSVNEKVAVERWIGHFPSLTKLAHEMPVFQPFITRVAELEVSKVTWWKVLEAVHASLVSVVDFISDIFTIFLYYNRSASQAQRQGDLSTYANAIIFFVVLTVFLQIFFVYIVHRKDGKTLRHEIFKCITFTKPAYNIFRVRTKAKPKGHELMNPVSELAWYRSFELFSESIPCTQVRGKNED